jgi:hypothetical protein
MMNTKLTAPFVIKHDCIIHSETGAKLPYLRVVAKIPKPTSLTVIVEFDDALSRRRLEELSWEEYRSWSVFCKKMIKYGYVYDKLSLLKSLHYWYTTNKIQITIYDLSTAGWHPIEGTSRYVYTNIIKKQRSKPCGFSHKGSFAQRFQYDLGVSASDMVSWRREIAPTCGQSPTLMVAVLSAFAATLLPAVRELPSFCIFYSADEASDREVIRYAAASVFGAPPNIPIFGKSPTALQLVADFRHGLVCSDIFSQATIKQIQSFFGTLLGLSGEISSVALPSDMRLLALTTGPHTHLDKVDTSKNLALLAGS